MSELRKLFHDLNNAFSVQLGMIDMILPENDPKKVAEMLSTMNHSINRAMCIVAKIKERVPYGRTVQAYIETDQQKH